MQTLLNLIRRFAGLTVLLTAAIGSAEAAVAPLQLPPSLVADVLAAAASPEATATPGAATRFYIDNRQPGLQLLQITLQVDRQAPIRYRYGDAESQAMLGQALHRVAVVELPQGPHQLYAEYVGRYTQDRPGMPRRRSRITQSFEQTAGTQAVEIALSPQGWSREPQIVVRRWTPQAGSSDDPELGAYDLLLGVGEPLSVALPLYARQSREGTSMAEPYRLRLDRALQQLQSGRSGHDEAASAMLQRYQSAVTSGDVASIGQLAADTASGSPEALAVRDKANAALGYQLLASGQPSQADAAFRRVRSPGPYSETALLGLGWAQIGNADTQADAGTQDTDALRRALVPWTELIGRDPTQAAVQESMLAVPYALERLGAHRQAQQRTQYAIDQLESLRGHLQSAQQHVASGAMLRWLVERERDTGDGWDAWYAALPEPRWWLTAPPAAPAHFYIERLLEDANFLQQLDNCHRLYQLRRTLRNHSDSAALQQRIASLEQPQRVALNALAQAQLALLLEQTERYLVEAHFAMGRLHDKPTTIAAGATP